MTDTKTPKQGDEARCKNCKGELVYDAYRNVGSYEPDYDPMDDPITWRHKPGWGYAPGYGRCAGGGCATPDIGKPNYVYVASSWRNALQPAVCAALKSAGIDHYDFKNPDQARGFHWNEVGMPSYDRTTNGPVPVTEYLAGIAHPRAEEGFTHDFDAMKRADACVMVLECGKSAHLEMGWMTGQGKRTCIFLPYEMAVPELMYKMCDAIVTNFMDLLEWLGVED
jgi:hypothetical protein